MMALALVLILALAQPFDWTAVGPERGSVTAIAAGPTMLAGTAEGRLFTWSAGSWTLTGKFSAPIVEIAVSAGRIWVQAGSDLHRSGTRIAPGVAGFAIAPSDPNTIYVATAATILRSVDGGANWTSLQGGAVSIDVDAADPAAVWAVRATGLVEKSLDAGNSWLVQKSITAPIRRIDAHPRRSGTAYAIGDEGVGFRTTDGQGWASLYHLAGRLMFESSDDRNFYAVDGTGRLFHSDDDGDWLDTVFGGPLLSLAEYDGVLYGGFREHGVQRSEDGGETWTPQRTGMLAADIHTLAAAGDGSVVYAGSVNTMFRSTDRGTTWDPVFTLRQLPGPFSAIAIDENNPQRVWIASGVSAWFTGDGGLHINRLFWNPAREPEVVTGIAFAPDDARSALVLMTRSFYRMDTEPLLLTDLSPSSGQFSTLAVAGNHLWIGGTRDGRALLLQSADGGRTWVDRSPATAGTINAVHAGSLILAGTSTGLVLRSVDGGLSWQPADIQAGPVRALSSDGRTFYAAGNGVFASSDGINWQNVSGSLSRETVTSLTSSETVFAGTASAGVFVQKPLAVRRRVAGR